MDKILITGSNGMLGNKLIYLLSNEESVQVIATSKGENRLVKKEGYTYQSMDITDREAVLSVMEEFKPNVVIHTAAITQVDICEKEKEFCDLVNIEGTKNVIAGCEEVGAKLIYISTDFIFDGESGKYVEGDCRKPVNYYGLSKRSAEDLVLKSKLSWTIVRTILLYGITENMSRSNIVLWVKKSLEEKKEIKVVSDQYRTPTLVDDLADACLKIVQTKSTGVFNISGNQYLSVIEIAKKVAGYYKLDESLISPVKSAELNQPGRRPARTSFDSQKAIDQLKYVPRSFDDGLKQFDIQLQKMLQIEN